MTLVMQGMNHYYPERFGAKPAKMLRGIAICRVFTLSIAALVVLSQPLVASGQTATELLAAGEMAYNASDWKSASDAFLRFLSDFGGLAETADAEKKIKPLLAICYVRMEQFEQALPLLEKSLEVADLDKNLRGDLVFFAGIGALRTGQTEIARKHLGAVFGNSSTERGRRIDALILGGMTYVMEENWKETINFFQRHSAEIRQYSAEAAARSNILLLHAMTRDGRWDDAVRSARDIHAKLDELQQVVTFCSMQVAMGDHFLEVGDYHKAITVLRMVPEQAVILSLQQRQLAEAEDALEMAEQGNQPVRAAQLRTSIQEMKRELEAFGKIPHFDSAARLRLATAYFQLLRTREACLILDQMVRQMEPDATVESATASLLRGWMSLDRHVRAVRTADLYQERCANLAEKPNLPEVLFLKAQAHEGTFDHRKAAEGFAELATNFPGHDIAARAEFMAAYNILQLEDYRRAGELLDRLLKKLKQPHEMWEHVVFWRAMAYYFDQDWEPCRKLLETILGERKAGVVSAEYQDDACFRIAFSHFSEAKYPEATARFKSFAAEFPTSEWLPEALLALGDSLAAEGDLDEADEVYAKISPEAPGFHDEGWMKRGNILKVRKDFPGMEKLYTEFLEQRPESPRLAEALQWLGWVAKQKSDIKSARDIYWQAIERFGNDMVRPGLEEIFLALQTLYIAADHIELETRLNDLLADAMEKKQTRAATRIEWALAQFHLSKKTSAENSTQDQRFSKCREQLIRLAPRIDPKETAPRIIADVADALTQSNDFSRAAVLYDGLRKWWPRAVERDRAFAGLGFIAAKNGDGLKALDLFDRYERTSVMPKSAPDANGIALVQGELGGKVAMARADLLAQRNHDLALRILLAIQKSKSMPSKSRAEALLKTARLHASRQRHRDALPYFEQIYVLFNRYPDMVADAYFERGQSLEKLGMNEKAREVYSELANRPDLVSYQSAQLGIERAKSLGGVIAPHEPTGSIIPPKSASQ